MPEVGRKLRNHNFFCIFRTKFGKTMYEKLYLTKKYGQKILPKILSPKKWDENFRNFGEGGPKKGGINSKGGGAMTSLSELRVNMYIFLKIDLRARKTASILKLKERKKNVEFKSKICLSFHGIFKNFGCKVHNM